MTAAERSALRDALVPLQVQVLHGVLPYLQSVRGKTFVVLCEGAVITDGVLRLGLGRDIALLQLIGVRLVILHGRPAAGASALEHQHQDLLQSVNQHGCNPVSLTASDGGSCGLAGGLLQRLHAKDFVPVVKPVRAAADGAFTAVDAVRLAFDLALQLKAQRLLLLSDDIRTGDSRQGVTGDYVDDIRASSDDGIECARVIDGRHLHALLLDVLSFPGSTAAVSPHRTGDLA